MAMTTPEAALFAARMADEDGSNASVPGGGQMDQGTSFHVQNLPGYIVQLQVSFSSDHRQQLGTSITTAYETALCLF